MMTQEGVDYFAGLLLGTVTPISQFYVFLFEGNYVRDGQETAADLPSKIIECTAYSEASRPQWLGVYDGAGSLDNLLAKATFTFPVAKRIYGGGIISTATKGGNTGLMLTIDRFSTPQDISAGEPFQFAASIPLIAANL